MPEASEHADVAIVGGGPGGYVAALSAARRGARVVLIEKDRVGGTCLNVGCIPTKALATSAELLHRCERARDFGITIPQATVDLPGLMGFKQASVDQLVAGVELLLRARRVDLVRGVARLRSPNTLSVGEGGDARLITAERVILAPGSIAAEPLIEGRDLPGVMTSTQALDIEAVPARLVVVGGGVIGLEFACIYEALGSRVTVVEMAPTVLAGATDEAVADRLQVILRRRGMVVVTGTTVHRITSEEGALAVHARGPGGDSVLHGDRVLLAVGRWPNTASLGLEEVGLEMKGRTIVVDEWMATSVAGVFAVGDAVGGWMLAHKAMVEGRVAAENATGGERQVDHRSVPNVIFTRPEVASVGLTELQARATGVPIKVAAFPFSANPRARIMRQTDGLVRLVCEAGSGRVLGMHVLGPQATDLVAEGALAVQLGATADDLAWTTHAHPTLAEATLEAALGFREAAIHVHSR